MTQRCKMLCQETSQLSQSAGKVGYTASFFAVHEGSEENKQFFQYTPAATLKLQTLKEGCFEAGKEYYIDIIPCEEKN